MAQPVMVATWKFGRFATAAGWKHLRRSPLDAVETGARAVEDAPSVDSVGRGSIPNRDGVLELDACIMDGRSLRFGSIAALRNIAAPISVARRLMEETDHLMLVGGGAYRFAREKGFRHENLMTAEARKKFYAMKKRRKIRDWHDTVGVLAMDANGDLAGACTTSGRPMSLSGRVGDSPLIGCGLYVDNRAGAAVCTGVGEEIMRMTCAAIIVEAMRRGKHPNDAIRVATKRIADHTRGNPDRPGAGFIAIDRKGRVGSGSVHRQYMHFVVRRGAGTLLKLAPGVLPSRKKLAEDDRA